MMNRLWFLILFFMLLSPASSWGQNQIAGYTGEQALQYGERMYREGILPSGVPMKATVMGDIPMDGRMFTCDDCHQRSGIGSNEGTIITWPTNGKELFRPRTQTGAYREPQEQVQSSGRKSLPPYYRREPARPAYTDETLARVLRSGIDPTGRKLDPVMPKYRFNKDNMAVMVHYLKNLSSEPSPGVNDTYLNLATIITEEVAVDKQEAMLDVLTAYVDAHNSQSRHEEKRARSGPFYKSEKHQSYRRIKLHVWTLVGPASSWAQQLEDYYSGQPVFAFVGGISESSWEPVHQFCEKNEIPSVFPLTDFPVVSDSDWYTLYFSKGFHQEGESAAKYIRRTYADGQDIRIVQVYDSTKPESAALYQGFHTTWGTFNLAPLENLDISKVGFAGVKQAVQDLDQSGVVIVLTWLDQDGFSKVLRESEMQGAVKGFLSSSSLQGENLEYLLKYKDKILLTYPASISRDKKSSRFAVEQWLKARNIEQKHFTIEAKTYFLGWMLTGAIKSMRSEFFREYFMEGFDMMIDQDYAIAVYPRLTFGPAQRYASKGCYLVQLSEDPEKRLWPVSDWVIY